MSVEDGAGSSSRDEKKPSSSHGAMFHARSQPQRLQPSRDQYCFWCYQYFPQRGPTLGTRHGWVLARAYKYLSQEEVDRHVEAHWCAHRNRWCRQGLSSRKRGQGFLVQQI